MDPETLMSQGEYQAAQQAFTQLADSAQGDQQLIYRLRAIAATAHTGKLQQAQQLLARINTQSIRNIQVLDVLRLTKAHLAIAERKAHQVQSLLAEPLNQAASAAYHADYHDLRADAFTLTANRLETARELVLRERYLNQADAIQKNQEDIWRALALLTERALQQLRTAPAPDELSGWMELVQISKVHQLSPTRLKEQIFLWRQRYPSHPVSETLLSALTKREAKDVAYPDHVALLLPLTGKFAQHGQALRDGFLAAYYTRRPNQNQTIRIYDVGEDPQNAGEIYQQAIKEGAQFVVGPLHKQSVYQISQLDELPAPTLALNYLPDGEQQIRSNLYQFGLLPEEEARQVAERTWLDGHVNAAVLVPAGTWGERIYTAFKERWELMGGRIVELQRYDTGKRDYATPIRMLLNVDDSRRRYQRVATTVKRTIKFTPRRRQDIDFIFLAAKPRQAQQIRPLLEFHHATQVPVYSTSHVFTGRLNQERDRDMDGIIFGDMPWVLDGNITHRGMRPEIENYISKQGNILQRIYALGIDAFNIIGALNTLRAYPYERYDGETGSLSLDNQLRIRRQLTWVKFRSGRPVSIDQGNL